MEFLGNSLVLLWRAFNAYVRGEQLTVYEHEWMGALVSSLAKKLAALLVTDSLPVAMLCSKFSLLQKIIDELLGQALKDYGR